MRTLFLLTVLAATSLPATAQLFPAWKANDPAYPFQRVADRMQQSPADSAAFARFGKAMARTTSDSLPPNDLSAYRLVWEVTCEGSTWLQRGNGTDLTTFLKDPSEKRFTVPVCCPSFYGGRYAVVQWEPPTGLVRFHYWFFERIQP